MSKKDEALKLAQAFIRWTQFGECRTAHHEGPIPTAAQVDAAICEALAEQFCDNHCTWLDHHPECDKAEQPAQQDLPDLIAGALGVSRGTAYDMMLEALKARPCDAKYEQDCTSCNALEELLAARSKWFSSVCPCGKQTNAWCMANTCSKAEQPAQQQCMEHGECFGGECIYPATQPAQDQGQSCYCPECERLSKELDAIKAQQPVAYMNQNGVIHPADYEWEGAGNILTPLYTSPQPAQQQEPDLSSLTGQADAHLRALLRYTENFYCTAIEHGMKVGPTADSVAHVERAGKALHQIVHAQAKMLCSPQPTQQQEPVVRSKAYDMIDRFLQNNLNSDEDYAEYSKALDSIYTSPPASKPWVGLVHEETHEAIGTAGVDLLELAKMWSDNKVHVYQFDNEARKIIEAVLRRASAKLREKNA